MSLADIPRVITFSIDELKLSKIECFCPLYDTMLKMTCQKADTNSILVQNTRKKRKKT